ncbi:MAG: hypothetical protein ACLT98_08625 [Eggerthellaceae bacterium]
MQRAKGCEAPARTAYSSIHHRRWTWSPSAARRRASAARSCNTGTARYRLRWRFHRAAFRQFFLPLRALGPPRGHGSVAFCEGVFVSRRSRREGNAPSFARRRRSKAWDIPPDGRRDVLSDVVRRPSAQARKRHGRKRVAIDVRGRAGGARPDMSEPSKSAASTCDFSADALRHPRDRGLVSYIFSRPWP